MRKTIVSLIFIAIALSQVSCSTEEEDNVLILTDENFDEEISKHKNILVEFYAPWCGHCKQLTPEYAKAAEILKNQNPPFYLAKVDATANQNLNTKFSIEGFPTLKFLSDGEWVEYTGGRNSKEIVSWVNKRMSPPTKEIFSLELFENEINTNQDVIFVIYFGNSTHESYSNFIQVAKNFDDAIFLETTNEEILNKFSAGLGDILLLKNFDEKINKFSGEPTEQNLNKFISLYSLPLVSPFDEKCAQTIFEGNNVGLFYLRDESKEEQTKFDNILAKLAPEYRENIIFVVSDIKNEMEERLAEYLNIKESDLPHIRLVDVKGEDTVLTYLMQGEINEENLKIFLMNFQNGLLIPYLKSEEEPQTQDEPVYKLVGTTFNKVVLESDKNVLVEFYAPWCAHCQKLEPIYTQLAEKYKGNNNLIIAKIDATANDLEFEIESFPTIKFYPANDKLNPIDFKGEREFDELVKFVEGLINPPTETEEKTKSDL